MTRVRAARIVVREGALGLGAFLELSFQRYPRPQSGVLAAASPSFGALPIGVGQDRTLLVPLDDDEALWVGLLERSQRVTVLASVLVETPDGALLDTANGKLAIEASDREGLVVPPARAVDGIARGDGTWWPLTRSAAEGAPSCAALHITAVPARQLAPPRRRREAVLPLRGPATRGDQKERPDESARATLDPNRWRTDRAATARISLVGPGGFTARTGLASPGPLRPHAAYRGWRFP